MWFAFHQIHQPASTNTSSATTESKEKLLFSLSSEEDEKKEEMNVEEEEEMEEEKGEKRKRTHRDSNPSTCSSARIRLPPPYTCLKRKECVVRLERCKVYDPLTSNNLAQSSITQTQPEIRKTKAKPIHQTEDEEEEEYEPVTAIAKHCNTYCSPSKQVGSVCACVCVCVCV